MYVIILFFFRQRQFFISDFVWAGDLTLNVPAYVRNGDDIWINCSADIVPSGKQTEFIVNGVTLDTLEKIENGCFSALKRAKCSSSICHCSADGKTYGRKLNINKRNDHLRVACSMNFKLKNSLYKTKEMVIRVLGKLQFIPFFY